jgi:phosphonopyruvate decarboxylase
LTVPGNQCVDFPALALAAGYKHARRIDSLHDWIAQLPSLMAMVGPGFVELTITPAPARFGPAMPQSEVPDRQFSRMGQEAEALSAWLSTSTA